MSDQPDRDQQTEEPTERKLQDARGKGNVPFSREPGSALVLVIAASYLVGMLPALAPAFAAWLRSFIEKPDLIPLETTGAFWDLAIDVAAEAGLLLLPLFILLILGPLLAAFAQQTVILSTEKLKPSLNKISPLAGAKRLVSAKSLVETLKNVAKVSAVGFICWRILEGEIGRADSLMQSEPGQALGYLVEQLARLLFVAVGMAALIAAADVLWQRISWHRSLMMTRQEMKDDMKQSDGDPHIKARLKALRMEKARRRMMAAVPNATVVITNPTHYAVALVYEKDKSAAPRVVAKGVDAVALKIREVAAASGVPIVENPPLARSLHATVDLDEVIKAEHYQAVADVIVYINNLKKGGAARA